MKSASDNQFSRVVVIIPAYNPDEKMLKTLRNLKEAGFCNIIVVNDGSKKECDSVFEQAEQILKEMNSNNMVLVHSVNLGQGRAYKTAFNYYLLNYSDTVGVIQCDADGQHHIEDVCRCTELLLQYPKEFILGVRDFNMPGIPFRSRFGNKCTSLVFDLFCGIKVKDTQTGLKGIPRELIGYLMETYGERFEYATSVLLEVNKRRVPIRQFDIQTIYIDGNESSHFNPILDSVKIYSVLLKHTIASLSAFVIDIVLFTFFVSIFRVSLAEYYIIAANYLAKVFSCAYSFGINKKLVYHKQGGMVPILAKYVLLCIVQVTVSSLIVNKLYFMLMWNETLIKIIVDTLLFFISYKAQRKWVFR